MVNEQESPELKQGLDQRRKRRVHFLIGALTGTVLLGGVVAAVAGLKSNGNVSDINELELERSCNVIGINLHGDLVSYAAPPVSDSEDEMSSDQTASEDVVYAITSAMKNHTAKAILLEVDSYGGYPVAGEEIAVALRNSTKPTVALIRQTGASAAYLAATGARVLFASKYSDLGGIGVTISYVDNVLKNQREGLTYNSLSSGEYKDVGDTNRPLTAADRALIMRDIKISHQDLIEDIARFRGIDTASIDKLADGSTMLGEAALKHKLIDRIGGMPEVEAYLAEQIGEEPIVCW